jgi:peptidoglycan/LPS O-acetylase OafA/YrhL
LFPALLAPAALSRKPAVGWITVAFCAAALAILCGLPPAVVQLPPLALPVFRCIPEFVLGMLAFRFAGTPMGIRVRSSRWIAPAVCLATLALLTIARTDLAVVLLFPILIVSVASAKHLPGRILASTTANVLGRLSYSLYLTHVLLAASLYWICLRTQDYAEGIARKQDLADGAFFVLMLLALPVAFITYKIIEVPGRRWIRALLETPARRDAGTGVSAERAPSPTRSAG